MTFYTRGERLHLSPRCARGYEIDKAQALKVGITRWCMRCSTWRQRGNSAWPEESAR